MRTDSPTEITESLDNLHSLECRLHDDLLAEVAALDRAGV